MNIILKTIGKGLLKTAGKGAVNSSLKSSIMKAGIQSGKNVLRAKLKEEAIRRIKQL